MNRILDRVDDEPTSREKYMIKGWSRSLSDFQADIVFLGDSITCGGEWSEYFPEQSVCNLSIPGDGIPFIKYRATMIDQLSPQKVFIMAGVNNIGVKEEQFRESLFSEEYRNIVKYLDGLDVEIFIESILPVCDPSPVCNSSIIKANEILKEIANDFNCTYVDLHSLFVDESGSLKKELSKDGVHLKPDSYAIWVDEIRKYVS